MKGRVLIVAGSDSGGGAGIQADTKTVTALGGYAATAITALTAQNTRGVFGVHDVPPAFIRQQMELVLTDIGADCIKTGMLSKTEIIEAIAATLDEFARDVPVVVDPVMMAKGGHPLLAPEAIETVRRVLMPRATVLTPNIPEAEALCGFDILSHGDMEKAARRLAELGPRAVLLKGGHMEGDVVLDLLMVEDTLYRFEGARFHTASTHGTGCTLASGIACGMAQGMSIKDSVSRARAYVRRAIELAPGFGHGHGPLWHGHTVQAFPKAL